VSPIIPNKRQVDEDRYLGRVVDIVEGNVGERG